MPGIAPTGDTTINRVGRMRICAFTIHVHHNVDGTVHLNVHKDDQTWICSEANPPKFEFDGYTWELDHHEAGEDYNSVTIVADSPGAMPMATRVWVPVREEVK